MGAIAFAHRRNRTGPAWECLAPIEQETHRMAEMFDFKVLGPLEIRVDDGPGPHLPPIQRRLLAVLLARAGRQLTPDQLADAVWSGSPPRSGTATLQVHLHRLRRALRDSRHIARGATGYRIEVDAAEFDAMRFTGLVDRGRRQRARGEAEAATASLHRALELWRGDAYAGVEASSLITAEAHRLGEDRLAARRELHELRLDLGRHEQVIAPLTDLLQAHPYHERLAALLMLALYRSGRQADALELYRARREQLIDELGVEPGALLRRMHEAVLHADDLLGTVATASLDGTWTPVTPAPVAAGPAGPVPRELPMAPHHFTGRERELRALDALPDGGAAAPLALITGMGGVGKTALAVHWAHRVADRFPDGQLFVDLRGHGGTALRPIEALKAMLGSLGLPEAQVPTELERAAARFRTMTGDRRVLIVFDNADGVEQVRPLLPGGSGCLVLVTSRHRLSDLMVRHGGSRVALEPLPSEEARSLLGRLLSARGDRASGTGIAALADLCGRLPLALRIAAANLADHPRYDFESYVARLAAGNRLTSLQTGESPDAALRTVFDSSYRGIPAEARTLFRRLSLIPGQDFTVEAAACLSGIATDDVEPVLGRLLAAHLVEPYRPGRYRLHDLLRLYAEERAADEDRPPERAEATQRLLGWYLHRADACRKLLYSEFTALDAPPYEGEPFAPTAAEAVAWLAAERGNLIAAVHYAVEHGPHHIAWLLNDALAGFMPLGMHTADALGLARVALAAAERAEDLPGQIATELSLAWTLLRSNESAEAVEHGERAARLAARADWLPGHAAAGQLLAFACAGVGRLREALDHCESALRANRRLGRRDAQLSNLEALGGVHMHLGDLDAAIAYFQQQLDAATEADGEVDAATLVNLAAAHLQRGRLDRARALVDEVLDPERGRAVTSPHSGEYRVAVFIHLAAGRVDEAMSCAQSAIDSLGDHPDRRRETAALAALAAVRDAQGRHREAIGLFDRSLELTEQGSYFHRVEAMLGRSVARFHLGELEQAREGALWTLEAARGSGYRIFEGRALNLLAEIEHGAGRRAEAVEFAESAVRVNRETGYRAGEAASLWILGRAESDAESGGRHRREALAIYADMRAAPPNDSN